MKSKANFKGHPIHPILISFPITLFFGTFVFDCLNYFTGQVSFFQTANYLNIAGIVAGLLAAVPGIIDYLFTVPPQSSAKKRATKHGLLNVTVVILFLIAFLVRSGDSTSVLILVLEFIGVILLVFSGWLGGTLVYRNQIGVDPRYANAGKWKETTVADSSGPVEIAKANELQVNQMKLIRLSNNKRIVLGRTETGYVAFDDHCTHKGGSLAGGAMICGTVQCPWHGSHFDVITGEVKAGPAKEKISAYHITEENGKIFLNLPL